MISFFVDWEVLSIWSLTKTTMAKENKYAHNCVCEVISIGKEIKFIFNGLN